jgi:hypothetical protein
MKHICCFIDASLRSYRNFCTLCYSLRFLLNHSFIAHSVRGIHAVGNKVVVAKKANLMLCNASNNNAGLFTLHQTLMFAAFWILKMNKTPCHVYQRNPPFTWTRFAGIEVHKSSTFQQCNNAMQSCASEWGHKWKIIFWGNAGHLVWGWLQDFYRNTMRPIS